MTAGASLQIRPFDESNLPAVAAFLSSVHGRVLTPEYLAWRFNACPILEGVVGMAGDACVATMFALRRTYYVGGEPVEILEPFEWHANEDWRAQAPGLRIVKRYMNEARPIIGLPGTDAAGGLLERLRWKHAGFADRYKLPLTGAYLRSRGRGALMARAFDLAGRRAFMPRRQSKLTLSAASAYAPQVQRIAETQKRFSAIRQPDAVALGWLHQAPAPVGHFVVLHASHEGRLVGWVTVRLYTNDTLRTAELLEVFMADEFRHLYRELVAGACRSVIGFEPDVIVVTTSCQDTAAALRSLRFRIDDRRPIYWWGTTAVPAGAVLVDGALGDHAFFPVPSEREAAWLESAR